MSNTALVGLFYQICELYIDHVLIHGKDAATFIANVQKVFDRLRIFNVKVNSKNKLGVEVVEYVGHVVSATDTSLTLELLLIFNYRRLKKHHYNSSV